MPPRLSRAPVGASNNQLKDLQAIGETRYRTADRNVATRYKSCIITARPGLARARARAFPWHLYTAPVIYSERISYPRSAVHERNHSYEIIITIYSGNRYEYLTSRRKSPRDNGVWWIACTLWPSFPLRQHSALLHISDISCLTMTYDIAVLRGWSESRAVITYDLRL